MLAAAVVAGHRRPLQVTNVMKEATAYVTPSGVMDYYEILGVDDDATPQQIKSAYRAMAKQCHPDFTGDKGHNMCVPRTPSHSLMRVAVGGHVGGRGGG